MILDIQIMTIDNELCLAKFAPKGIDQVYNMDSDGYIKFSMDNFSWQRVASLHDLSKKVIVNSCAFGDT